jgi:hypothetical protein
MVTPWFIVELRQSCLATKGAYLRPCSQKVVTAARELHSYLYLLEKVLGWKTNASADDTVCQLMGWTGRAYRRTRHEGRPSTRI